MQNESGQDVNRGRLTWSFHVQSIYWARKGDNDKMDPKIVEILLSPHRVSPLLHVIFIACSKCSLWDTDLTHHTWIEFTSESALFKRSALVCCGDSEQGWVSLTQFILQPWALIYPDFSPVYGLPRLLQTCLFFSFLHLSPMSFPWHFPPRKSTIGHVAVNCGQAWRLRKRETTGQVWGMREFL